MMNNTTNLDKNVFLEHILRDFLHRSKKGEQAQDYIDKVYDGYKTLLENQSKVSMDRSEEIKDFYDILDRVYKMFSDPETRELIVNSGLGKMN